MARIAIVTGGSRGIGEAISLALKDAGATVIANYAGNDERAREFSERTGIRTYNGMSAIIRRASIAAHRSPPRSGRSTSSLTTPESRATERSRA